MTRVADRDAMADKVDGLLGEMDESIAEAMMCVSLAAEAKALVMARDTWFGRMFRPDGIRIAREDWERHRKDGLMHAGNVDALIGRVGEAVRND